MNTTPDTRSMHSFTPRLVIGIGIIVIGVLLTLDNLFHVNIFWKLWPVILVVLGILKLRTCEGTCTSAYVLMGAGAILLILNFGHGHLENLIFPMILVTVGVFILLSALRHHRGVPEELKKDEGFLQGTAILSGFKHRLQTQAFKGGELTAVFGGFDVDLRQATMEGDRARLDLFVLFGGGDIRVPQGWDVQIQTTAIAGAVENKALPTADPGEDRPRLLITGMTLFGGVDIKD